MDTIFFIEQLAFGHDVVSLGERLLRENKSVDKIRQMDPQNGQGVRDDRAVRTGPGEDD